jgi:hypothetical protein
MRLFFICLYSLLLFGCRSYYGSVSPAQIVTSDEEINAATFDLSIENKESRNKYFDYNNSAPMPGVSFHKRWPLSKNKDFGIGLSLEESAIDLKYSLYSRDGLFLSLSPVLVLPLYSLDKFDNYQINMMALGSLNISNNLSLYTTYGLGYIPFNDSSKFYTQLSLGMMYGKDCGWIFNWLERKSVTEAKYHINQIAIGFFTSTLEKKEISYINSYTFFAANNHLMFKAGVLTEFALKESKYLGVALDYGVGPSPISLQKYSSRGWISGYQGHIFFKDASYVRSISYLLGIEYHQYDINIYKDMEWRRLIYSQWGLELGLEVKYKSLKVDIISLSIPMLWLQAEVRSIRAMNFLWIYPKEIDSYIRNKLRSVEISFLRTKISF